MTTTQIPNIPTTDRVGSAVAYEDMANARRFGVIDGFDYGSGFWTVTWFEGGMSTVSESMFASNALRPGNMGWRVGTAAVAR